MVGEVQAERVADEAVGAVGAHDVLGADVILGGAVGRIRYRAADRDAVVVLVEPDSSPASTDGHRGQFGRDLAQTLFELWLGEPVARAPPRGRDGFPVHLEQSVPRRVAPVVQVVVELDRRIVIRIDAENGEDAGDFVIERHGPGLFVGGGPLVDDGDAMSLPTQQNCQQGADRSASDDGDIGVELSDASEGKVWMFVMASGLSGDVRHTDCHNTDIVLNIEQSLTFDCMLR